MTIRRAKRKDLDDVVMLNNLEAEWVGAKEEDFFKKNFNIPFFNIFEYKKQIYGFLMVFSQNNDYDSKNFLWFKERYPEFYYVDRILISKAARGKGIGTKMYEDLIKNRKKIPIVCKVDVNNNSSIKFHEKLGFESIGIYSPDEKKLQRMYLLE